MNGDGIGDFFGNLVDKFGTYKLNEQAAEIRQSDLQRSTAALDQRPAESAKAQSYGGINTTILLVTGGVILAIGAVILLRRKG